MKNKKTLFLCICFVFIQLVLYVLILTQKGKLLVASEFTAIVLCALFTLLVKGKTKGVLPLAMGFTVLADFCLVICSPIRRTAGMLFFMCVQGVYAFILHRQNKNAVLRFCRLGLSGGAIVLTLAVLGKSTDLLALVSLCYYANLVFNLFMAFLRFKSNRVFAFGLLLFLCCDTVVGLQVASGAYLNIAEGTFLHSVISAPVNLAWMFYLPSQVLLSFSDKTK